MRNVTSLFIGSLLAVSLAGCANVGMPTWYNWRTAEEQQIAAQRFDPYPETDVGPNVMGGRPREYEEPVVEPSRARWSERNWLRRFGF